ncbi:hypothetical protein Tco_1194090 [Tanacetum coccineum]
MQARGRLNETSTTYLKITDHLPPNEKCMALLLVEERFLKIKQVMKEEQNQPEVTQELLLKLMDDLQILKGSQQERRRQQLKSYTFWSNTKGYIDSLGKFWAKLRCFDGASNIVKGYYQELMSKLLEDVRNISEEFSEYINCPSWNCPLFYFDDDDDEYTIIWRRSKAITPDEPSEEPKDPLIMGEKELSTQDIPITSPKIDFLSEEFAGEFAPIPPGMDEDKFDEEEVDYYDHDISSDDDSYENIEYVEASPLNLEYIIEPDQGGLTGVVISDNSNDPLLELPEFESFHFDFDPSFPRPPPEPSDVEISLIIETDAHVINDFGELNEDEYFDPGGGENNVEVDNSFTIVTRTFLPFLTYPEISPLLSSTKNEETIYDPDIFT